MNLKVGQKIFLGFGVVLASMTAIILINLFALSNLIRLQDAGFLRSTDAVLAAEAASTPTRLSMIITTAEINRDLASSEKSWSAAKAAEIKLIDDLAKAIMA
ncbi:MAG: hypothetical protein Q8M76_07940 [Spirochaetaceae bacterium]|nr:hypothetical protein [Spirochaetaceae bacterium]